MLQPYVRPDSALLDIYVIDQDGVEVLTVAFYCRDIALFSMSEPVFLIDASFLSSFKSFHLVDSPPSDRYASNCQNHLRSVLFASQSPTLDTKLP